MSVVCPGFVQSGIYEAATIVNADKTSFFARVPFRMLDADRAAMRILAGVEKNDAVIVFPFYARLIWWLGRLHTALGRPLQRRLLAEFRATRRTP